MDTEKKNDRDWEAIYKSILEDIVKVIEDAKADDEKVERITAMLVGNDFMEKPLLYG